MKSIKSKFKENVSTAAEDICNGLVPASIITLIGAIGLFVLIVWWF